MWSEVSQAVPRARVYADAARDLRGLRAEIARQRANLPSPAWMAIQATVLLFADTTMDSVRIGSRFTPGGQASPASRVADGYDWVRTRLRQDAFSEYEGVLNDTSPRLGIALSALANRVRNILSLQTAAQLERTIAELDSRLNQIDQIIQEHDRRAGSISSDMRHLNRVKTEIDLHCGNRRSSPSLP